MTTANNTQPNSARAKSVLVYQIGSLGDTLVSIPAYRAVRRHFGPDAQIRVLHNAPPNNRASPHQVLEGSDLINGAVTFQQYNGRSTWKTWIEVWSKLRQTTVDALVYIAPAQRTAKQIKRDELFFRLLGIRRLIGFHPCDLSQFCVKDTHGNLVAVPQEAILRIERLENDGLAPNRTADFAIPLLVLPEDEQQKALQWLTKHQGMPQRLVAVCPGANQPANFWPLDRFEQIGRRLEDLGLLPLVIGGPAEKEMGDQLVAAWGRGINAAGEFSVLGSAALLRHCQFLIGLDTGTTHLAAALGVPCVVVSGERESPGQWKPLGKGHKVLRHPVPCSGCRKSVCPVPDHPCMTGISVEQAWEAIQEINARAVNTVFA